MTVGFKPEMMLITGYSGIGKSALVKEIHKNLTKTNGFFISGKFDQFQRNVPYSAIVSAFSDLIRQLLTESTEQFQGWKEKILSVLGNNSQLIIDIIPEIEMIIGPQPPVPELGPTESQNRFNLVLQNFIRIFAQPEHPLVMFLDDLQWADSATLKLLELMMTNEELRFLFLIGAYRDNEISPTHPLSLTLEKLQKEDVAIHQITLGPLTLEHVIQLIAQTLHSDLQTVQPLAELVTRKTGGNPFFVNQFLKTLYDENLLSFKSPLVPVSTSSTTASPSRSLSLSKCEDRSLSLSKWEDRSLSLSKWEESKREEGKIFWQWDIAKIEALNITDNVVDLMIGQLKKLPEATQRMLRLAACIGNRFELSTLSLISKYSTTEISQQMLPAFKEGLVQNTGKKAVKSSDIQNGSNSQLPITDSQFLITHYQFLHDRVQQAAYALIPEFEKTILHLKMGRLLLENTADEILSEHVFEIVDHLNLGLALVNSPVEKEEIAHLNLKAGQKAKAATAYEAAVKYLETGLKQLSSDCWETQYDLTLALHLEIVEAGYLNTQFEQAEQWAQTVLQQAQTVLDKVKVYELKITFDAIQNRFPVAVDTGLAVLEMLEVSLIKEELPQTLTIEEFSQLPTMTDPAKQAAMRILMNLFAPALITNPVLLPQIAYTMINLCIRYGNSSASAFAYVFYGVLLCSQQQIEKGYQFGQLALMMLEKFEAKEIQSRVTNLFCAFVSHWKVSAQESILPLPDVVQIGLENGDMEYAGYAALNYCSNLFLSGKNLKAVHQVHEQYQIVIKNNLQDFSLYYLKIWAQLVLNLSGQSQHRSRLIGDWFNEEEMLLKLQEMDNMTSLYVAYISKMISSYLFKDSLETIKNASLAVEYESAATGIMATGQRPFYHSLALLAQYPSADKTAQVDYLAQVTTNQQQMKKWAEHAPMNFQHKYDLVEAEKARVLGQNWEAAELYEKAMAGAKENQYLHEEALAYELAAEFYLAQGRDKFAQNYFKEAHYRYQQWGALAKVADLEQRYPQFLAKISESAIIDKLRTTSTVLATRKIGTTGNGRLSLLDLETVMKASQTIAGEVQLEKLLVHLMNIIIENAGAEKGFLLLEKHRQWLIEAEGTTNHSEIKVLQSDSINNRLPTAIINYVARTQKPVILNEATHEGEFTQTPYILTNRPKSILCVPLVNQGKLSAIVYLENNLATGAFTSKRVETVQLLGSQAAISLDNARLYEELAEYNNTLEAKVTERTQELSQALNHLKTTQQELVQSEKMAALGQLVAGIAHEINTPLGAIRASIGNIVDGLNQSVQQLPQLLQKLSLEQQHDFFALSETALKNKKNLTSREERKIRRKIRSQLEDYEIENADEMADTLVDMGIYENLEPFVSLFQSQHKPLILQVSYHLTMQQIHSQNILTAVERASKVVFALKSYARYDNESKTVKAKVTDGIDVVLTLYHNQLKHGVEVTSHYQEIPEILCYPDELNQVWTNLIHNAIQAMENQGNLNITVTEADNQILVQITDSGQGIPDEIKPRIFEPFFTTKPTGEGSGLGLDIVKKIIDKHHGKIEVESQPGKTTFSVYLPIQS